MKKVTCFPLADFVDLLIGSSLEPGGARRLEWWIHMPEDVDVVKEDEGREKPTQGVVGGGFLGM